MMTHLELAMGRLLLIGTLVSLLIVTMGGSAYLYKHSADIIQYQSFQKNSQTHKSMVYFFTHTHLFSSLDFIQIGLLLLVILQIFRIGMISGLCIQSRDKPFTYISLFILLVLIYSLFWRF